MVRRTRTIYQAKGKGESLEAKPWQKNKVDIEFYGHCLNVVRKFIIDTNGMQNEAYEILRRAHETTVNKKLSNVYQSALSLVGKQAHEFVLKLINLLRLELG